MTHPQWVSEIKRSLEIAERAPDEAVRRLKRLLRKIEVRQRRVAASEWHLAQTLGAIGSVLSGSGRHAAAAKAFGRLAKHHELKLVYQQTAFVSALASEAIELISAGQIGKARTVVRLAERRAASMRGPNWLLEHARKALATAPKALKLRRARR